MFDGGGHIQAAGFKIKNGDLSDTEQKIIKKVREFQAKRLNIHPDEHPEVISGPDLKNEKALKESVWQKEETPKIPAKSQKSTKEPSKKLKNEELVENIPDEQDEIDMEPGVTYKFEE